MDPQRQKLLEDINLAINNSDPRRREEKDTEMPA